MAVLVNLARMTTATTGTGTITLGSAVSGFLSFAAAGVTDGQTVTYAIHDGANSEVGRGVYTSSGTTLTRNVLASTNSGSAINLSGTAEVFVTAAAQDFGTTKNLAGGRLTLTSGTAVTTSDVTAATTVYYTPYDGSELSLYDGTGWLVVPYSEVSIKLTDAQTGTRASTGNGIITGLTDTSQLVVGMEASGTGIGASAVISSIDSATQVTLSVNNSATGTATVTFKAPASTMYDVFGVRSAGTVKLELVAWTNDTTRAVSIATQDGIDVKSGDATRRLIGSVRTTATAGQTEDSLVRRYLSNRMNAVPRNMAVNDPTFSWNYSTSAWRQANANTDNQIDCISCVPRAIAVEVYHIASSSVVQATNLGGVGINSTTDVSLVRHTAAITSTLGTFNATAKYTGYTPVGRTKYLWLEYSNPNGGTSTFYGTVTGSALSGIMGMFSA